MAMVLQAFDMQSYREGFVHVLYAIILVQFVVIAVLISGFSNEYMSNIFFRAWINGNYPWLGTLLQGQVDALLVGMTLGATILLIQRIQNENMMRSGDRPAAEPVGFRSLDESGDGYDGEAMTNKPSGDAPEDVLAELERQDT